VSIVGGPEVDTLDLLSRSVFEELMNELITALRAISKVVTDLGQCLQLLPCSSNCFISMANLRVFVFADLV
jgi:hypothetical protein